MRYGDQLEFPNKPPPFELRLHCDAFHILLLGLRSPQWSKIYKVMIMRTSLSHRYKKTTKLYRRCMEQTFLIAIPLAGVVANLYVDCRTVPRLSLLVSGCTAFSIGLLAASLRPKESDPIYVSIYHESCLFYAMLAFVSLLVVPLITATPQETSPIQLSWPTGASLLSLAFNFFGPLIVRAIVASCATMLGYAMRHPTWPLAL